MTKRTFELAGATAPTAGTLPAARGPQSSGAPAISKPLRTGFTWRQTADERDTLDDLVKTVSRRLGRSVDKATVLAELVAIGSQDDAVLARLLAALAL